MPLLCHCMSLDLPVLLPLYLCTERLEVGMSWKQEVGMAWEQEVGMAWEQDWGWEWPANKAEQWQCEDQWVMLCPII